MEGSKVLPLPSRREVEAKLLDLVEGRCTREEAAGWAGQWVLADDVPVDDFPIWDALGSLAGADLKTIDRPYLHEENDFRAWLKELQDAPSSAGG